MFSFFSKSKPSVIPSAVPYAKTARILIAMSIPGNILFIFAADYINMSTSTVSWVFVVSYLTASLVQVSDGD